MNNGPISFLNSGNAIIMYMNVEKENCEYASEHIMLIQQPSKTAFHVQRRFKGILIQYQAYILFFSGYKVIIFKIKSFHGY